jgi:WD40 repeat protein
MHCVGLPLAHPHAVHALAFSPDGTAVLTGGGDLSRPTEPASVRLWDAATGKLLLSPIPHPDVVHGVAFRSDGRAFVTGCRDGKLRLCEIGALRPTWRQQLGVPILSAAFSPDGRCLLAGGGLPDDRGEARVWDTATGHSLGPLLRLPRRVRHVEFHPNGQTFVTTSRDAVRFWETSTSRAVGEPLPLADRFETVGRYSLDGSILVTYGHGGPIQRWDTTTRQPIGPPLLPGTPDQALAFSPDGRLFAMAGQGGRVGLWEVATLEARASFSDLSGNILAVGFRPDGRVLLTGGADGKARLLAADTGRPLLPPLSAPEKVWAVQFRRDGAQFLTMSGEANRDRQPGQVRVWETATGQRVGPPLPQLVTLPAAGFSPDGLLIVTGGWDGDIRLWDAATGRAVGPPLVRTGPISCVTFTRDGRTLATTGRDGLVSVWPVPQPLVGSPEQLRLWAQILTGLELDSSGSVQPLRDPQGCRETLRRLGGPPRPSLRARPDA